MCKRVYLHRWLLSAQPGQLGDHINGDKLDNRRIRAAMKSQGERVVDKATGEIISRTFRLTTRKNKVSGSPREAEVKVYLDTGRVDVFEELAVIGKSLGLFTRENGSPLSGSSAWWFDSSEGFIKLGVGPKQVADTLDQHRALALEVEAGVRARIARLNEVRPPVHESYDEADDSEFDTGAEALDDEAAGDRSEDEVSPGRASAILDWLKKTSPSTPPPKPSSSLWTKQP